MTRSAAIEFTDSTPTADLITGQVTAFDPVMVIVAQQSMLLSESGVSGQGRVTALPGEADRDWVVAAVANPRLKNSIGILLILLMHHQNQERANYFDNMS